MASSLKLQTVLKVIVDFCHSVDWSGKREDSCGSTGQGKPRRRWERRGGSPQRPRKAKRLERKSTDKFNTAQNSYYIPL